jgi:hypothetical protein
MHLGDVVLVHAAIRPGWGDLRLAAHDLESRFRAALSRNLSPFNDDDVRFALTARFCTRKGKQSAVAWPPPTGRYRNWLDWYSGRETLVFGHFAHQGLRIDRRARGLDTGCVYGGELTAWIAEEDRIVSVPAE